MWMMPLHLHINQNSDDDGCDSGQEVVTLVLKQSYDSGQKGVILAQKQSCDSGQEGVILV